MICYQTSNPFSSLTSLWELAKVFTSWCYARVLKFQLALWPWTVCWGILIQTILFHVEWREIYAVCLFRSLICFPSHRYPYINKDKCTHLLTLRQERNTQTDTQRERERALVFDSRELVTPKHCQVLPSSSIITCGELPVRALSSQNTISKCYNHQH